MLRRVIAAHQRQLLLGRPLSACERRCATSATEKKAASTVTPSSSPTATSASGARISNEVAHAAAKKTTAEGSQAPVGGAATSRAVPHGPQRKDWRTHRDIVYVKGVPAKGKVYRLPYPEQFIIYLVFSITGAGAVYFVRPQIRYLCHHGFLGLTENASWVNGPWLYRLMYVLIMFPCYSLLLFLVGSFFGRRIWFSFMIHKMWSRFLTEKASTRLTYILDIQHY